MGYVLKLLAIAKNTPAGISVGVHPAFVPESHPLASVNDVFNAVFLRGNACGEIMLYGRGAGELPTASSVVGDVMSLAQKIVNGDKNSSGFMCYKNLPLCDRADMQNRFYIRMTVTDRPKVLAGVAGVLGDFNVSIGTVQQSGKSGKVAELIIITHLVREGDLMASLEVLKTRNFVNSVDAVIRVEAAEEL